jgi:orotate phosphoribosyltransferase
MTFTSTAKPRLVELVKELAVVHGKVTLSSGIEADYYVDLRRATLHHEAAPLIGQVMLDMLDAAGITDFDAVGGLTMGADPVATAILHQAAARGRKVDAFVVRKAAKAHGMGRQVEGPDVKGKRVIVVEDTSTTGGSPLTAAEALVNAGAIIVAVATVVDRSTGAQKVIEEAGYQYFSAIGLTDLNLA